MSKIRVNSIVNKDDTGGPLFLKGAQVPSGQIFKCEGDVTVSGILTATSFVGDGSALSNLTTITAGKSYGMSILLDPLPFRA